MLVGQLFGCQMKEGGISRRTLALAVDATRHNAFSKSCADASCPVDIESGFVGSHLGRWETSDSKMLRVDGPSNSAKTHPPD